MNGEVLQPPWWTLIDWEAVIYSMIAGFVFGLVTMPILIRVARRNDVEFLLERAVRKLAREKPKQ